MNVFENDMGLMYIAEQTNYDDRVVTNLDVVDKGSVFYVSFDTVLHSFGVINRNKRMYTANNVWDCLLQEKIQSLLMDNAWYGEMNHPTQETKNSPLTPERIQDIWLPNRSHKIMKPKIVGNLLQARIETASGTEAGVGFGKEIIQGLNPAFSCRAIATLQMIGGKPTVVVRRVITYDWVLFPSHKEAHAISTPRVQSKSFQVMKESGQFEDIYVEDVTIPLNEILEYVGKKDVNTQMIMESFDLGTDSLIGIDKTMSKAIIKDDNNIIYANINPNVKREVNDFFASF